MIVGKWEVIKPSRLTAFLLINSILFANEDEAVPATPRSPGPPVLKQPETAASKAQTIILRIVAQEVNR